MDNVIFVGLAGFFGAIARFGLSQAVKNYFTHPFPMGTLVVNVVGCFAIGGVVEYFRDHENFSTIFLVVAVGFLGAFTTFSAFSLETIHLMKNSQMKLALVNIGANVLICLGAVYLGSLLVSAIFRR